MEVRNSSNLIEVINNEENLNERFGNSKIYKRNNLNIIYGKFSNISKKEGWSYMTNEDSINKIIDRMDQDRRDQEQRLNENIRSMEQRITEERRLSEERMEKKFIEAMNSIKETNKKLDNMNSKLDEKVETINLKIDEKIDRISDKLDNTNKWIIGVCLSTIIGIAAMVITIILTR